MFILFNPFLVIADSSTVKSVQNNAVTDQGSPVSGSQLRSTVTSFWSAPLRISPNKSFQLSCLSDPHLTFILHNPVPYARQTWRWANRVHHVPHTPAILSSIPGAAGLFLSSDQTPWMEFTAPLHTTCATHLSIPFLHFKMKTILLNRTVRITEITPGVSQQWPPATKTNVTTSPLMEAFHWISITYKTQSKPCNRWSPSWYIGHLPQKSFMSFFLECYVPTIPKLPTDLKK